MANVSSIKLPNNTIYNIVDKTSGYTKNSGTVTSVAVSAGTGISVSGSPITSNGTITISNSGVTGVKGSAESSYRTGQVNLTAANIGAISKSDELLTTNPFAPNSLKGPYISKIDNAFYAADKRWTITATNTSSNVSVLFDGSYETQLRVNDGETSVITFDFSNSTYFPGYPYGYILVSFYHVAKPASISGRVYCNYSSHGIGWHNISFTPIVDNTTSQITYRSEHQGYYQISQLEITIVGDTSNSYGYTGVTQIEMHLDRPSSSRNPFLSKYEAETLYYDLTAPNFRGNLIGNVTGNVSGSAGSVTWSGVSSKPTTLSGYGITDAKIANGTITLGSNTITPLTSSSTLNAAKLSGAIPSAVTATTQASTDNSTKIATTAYVTTAIANLPEPMVFKGSVGTGGTVTSLPTAAAANEGWTYKVITALSSPAAKVGDTVISNGSSWVVIPSGDEPSGTVTSIATGAGLTGGTITTSGTIKANLNSETSLGTIGTTDKLYAVGVDSNGKLATSIPAAAYNQSGVVKPYRSHSVAVTSFTPKTDAEEITIYSGKLPSGRYYGIETDVNGVMFVGVPWTDTGAKYWMDMDNDAVRSIGAIDDTPGYYSVAEGHYTIASGNYSHAEGNGTHASGEASHAEGYHTTASGGASHAEGQAIASGIASHAEGTATASGLISHAQNEETIAAKQAQTALGSYNIEDTATTTTHPSGTTAYGRYAVIIGNGTDASTRSNALTLDWSGNEVLAGKLTVGVAGVNSMDVATVGQIPNVPSWAMASTKPTYTASEVGAQPTLISGTNIKTINSTSLLGSGNLTIDTGAELIELTQAQYNALSQAEKDDPDKLYFITDSFSSTQVQIVRW